MLSLAFVDDGFNAIPSDLRGACAMRVRKLCMTVVEN